MLALPINIFLLGGLLLGALFIGFIFRRIQLKALKRKIGQLESEILANHAEILEMQKERVLLEQKFIETLSSPNIPVIPINSGKEKEEKTGENIPDIALRKKLLSKKSADKHS